LLTDSGFYCRSFPVSYQPFYKLYYSSNIDSDPCADTARFDVHVDESFRGFKVFFGDGDSLAFNPPLAKSYKLKHVYKTPGTYYFEVRGLSPTCDYYNRSGDSVTVYNAPSRIKTSSVVKPGCDLSKLQLTDSLQNTRFAYYQWQASLNDTVIIPYGQNAYSIAHQKIYSTPSVKEILKLELRNQYCPNSVVYNDTFYPVFYPKLELNYKIEGVSTILTRDTLKSKIRYSACAPLKFIYSDSSESIIKASLSYNSIDVSRNTAFAIPVMLNSGEYAFYVNDTNTNACAASDTFYVRAYERPMANFQLNDTAQCFAGNEFQVQLFQSDSSNTNTFYWMPNDSVALKPNISVLHAYAKPGTYAIRLKVKNSENCYSIKDSIIQVYQQPNAEFVLNRSALCLKDNLFVFTPSGQGQHAWDFGDIQTSDSSIVQHHFNRTGQYTIQHTIKTNVICTDTVRKNVNVWEMPIAGILTSDTLQCLENNLISLKSSSIYSQIDSLQQILYWGDGANVNFSNNSILTHQYLQKGKYTQRLVVQTKHFCKDSISSFVQIADMPKLTILKDGFCLGETSVLKALVNNGVAVKTYNWIVQGKQESSKLDSIHHGFSAAGTYKVKVEGMSDAQCLGVDSTVIEILEKPQSIFTYILGGNGKF
jgi:PKD repeat protein